MWGRLGTITRVGGAVSTVHSVRYEPRASRNVTTRIATARNAADNAKGAGGFAGAWEGGRGRQKAAGRAILCNLTCRRYTVPAENRLQSGCTEALCLGIPALSSLFVTLALLRSATVGLDLVSSGRWRASWAGSRNPAVVEARRSNTPRPWCLVGTVSR